MYSFNMIKKFIPNHTQYNYLPEEVRKALLVKFNDMTLEDFNTISKLDNLTIPPALHITKIGDEEVEYVPSEETSPINLEPQIGRAHV